MSRLNRCSRFAPRRHGGGCIRSIVILALSLCATPLLRADDTSPPIPLTAQQKERLKERDRYLEQAAVHFRDGQLDEALAAAKTVLAIEREVFGPIQAEVTESLNMIARIQQARSDFIGSRASFQERVDLLVRLLGAEHWRVTDARQDLADNEQLARMPATDRLRLENAVRLNNRSAFLYGQGEFRLALAPAREALAIRKAILGENHRDCAICLNNLAMLYDAQGDYEQATPLFLQVLEILKKAVGKNHPIYATSLNNLARLYQGQGDYAQAEPLFRAALEILKKAVGENDPLYASSLNNLAALYHDQGDLIRAEPLYRQTVEIFKKTRGENHPDYALSLNNLGTLYADLGNYALAEPLLRQALEIRKRTLGENHPDYAQNLNNLAVLYDDQGESARAKPLAKQAITLALQHLETSAAAQSERQQLAHAATLRRFLDNYLACGSDAGNSAVEDYALVLSWKGAVTARQRLARAARWARSGNPDPEVLRLCAELEAVSRQLALLSRSTPDPLQLADLPTRLHELGERRERLEADLSQRTEAFRRLRASRGLTPAALQRLLPEDAALVDFLEYGAPRERREGRSRLTAFVVRRQGITRVELGQAAPLAEAIAKFRGTMNRARPVTGPDDPAVLLRQRLWMPLEESLAGARLVLISPDGALNGLPFGALPGRDDNTYLLEDVALAVLPVPQLLPELLAKRNPGAADTPPSLLALGDVDFDSDLQGAQPAPAEPEAAAGWHRRRAGGPHQWTRLEGTRGEVLSIADTFRAAVPQGKLEVLRERNATAAALRRQAPECEYLHVATHGYFADPSLKSAITATASKVGQDLRETVVGHDPGLLSALVFAGANHPTDEDDGVLTALEVSELELSRVELAVLSACETGLGEVAGGEGVLGLQRAFQVAGARTLVTSLWKADDQATRQLMERFYESYWKKGLGAQEALREAQLWLLREGVKRDFGREVEGEKAGARTPPLYWAAFVLSGDWR